MSSSAIITTTRSAVANGGICEIGYRFDVAIRRSPLPHPLFLNPAEIPLIVS